MNPIQVSSLKYALDFTMQLNQTNPSDHYTYIAVQKSEDQITITDDVVFPIEDTDYQLLMTVDSQIKDAPIKPLEKWKKLLDRLAQLDGMIVLSIQFRPDPKPNSPDHESH